MGVLLLIAGHETTTTSMHPIIRELRSKKSWA
jgi:cytochrome P450